MNLFPNADPPITANPPAPVKAAATDGNASTTSPNNRSAPSNTFPSPKASMKSVSLSLTIGSAKSVNSSATASTPLKPPPKVPVLAIVPIASIKALRSSGESISSSGMNFSAAQ